MFVSTITPPSLTQVLPRNNNTDFNANNDCSDDDDFNDNDDQFDDDIDDIFKRSVYFFFHTWRGSLSITRECIYKVACA